MPGRNLGVPVHEPMRGLADRPPLSLDFQHPELPTRLGMAYLPSANKRRARNVSDRTRSTGDRTGSS